jgi:FKBP-type peptidyl-prolyl cis-trans isomerase 2
MQIVDEKLVGQGVGADETVIIRPNHGIGDAELRLS